MALMSKATSKATTTKELAPLDPLYVIFEQHLYNFQDSDSDRKTFIGNIVKEYLAHLRRNEIVVPQMLENQITEELASQVNTMLVKKIYGCVSIQDFREKAPSTDCRRAKTKYTRVVTK